MTAELRFSCSTAPIFVNEKISNTQSALVVKKDSLFVSDSEYERSVYASLFLGFKHSSMFCFTSKRIIKKYFCKFHAF